MFKLASVTNAVSWSVLSDLVWEKPSLGTPDANEQGANVLDQRANGMEQRAIGLKLFALALVLRWSFAWLFGTLLLPDSWGRYLPIADQLFDRWSGSVYDAPAYPFFLAIFDSIHFRAAFYVQGLLDALSVVIIYLIAFRLGLGRAARYVGLFFCIHAGSIMFANTALSETLFTSLTLMAIYMFLRLETRHHCLRLVPIGLICGLIVICRSNGFVLPVTIVAVMFITYPKKGRFACIIALLLSASLPAGLWRIYTHQESVESGVATGVGWQLLNNMAYFGLIDANTFPEDYQAKYTDFESLAKIRRMVSQDPTLTESKKNRIFGAVAWKNLKARPMGYLSSIPKAFLTPRHFVKDVTRLIAQEDRWRETAELARQNGRSQYMKPADNFTGRTFRVLYRFLRIITIIPGKIPILMFGCLVGIVLAWRTRRADLLLANMIAMAQFIGLTAILNPIDRYYYPFESLMVISLVASVLHFRSKNRVE